MGKINETCVVIRGGGDLATGVIQKFYRSGFKVAVLEIAEPLMIRRNVSLGMAVIEGESKVEDLVGVKAEFADLASVWKENNIPVLVDPHGELIDKIKPQIVIDAILAKKNLGTYREMAPITIALGPGFSAPKDVNIVIETMRGHDLGRLIMSGKALPNTGIPGTIKGENKARVIHAPIAGKIEHLTAIGDFVKQGEALFKINETNVYSPLTGTLRGLIQEGINVEKGLKVADVDPRVDVDCQSISDKARALGGASLEAALYLLRDLTSC